MKYRRLVYEMIRITKRCVTFKTYARNCNFHKEMKTTVTLWDTHVALCLSQHRACIYMYLYKTKSGARKRCSLRYTYRRGCSSAIETKLTPHNKKDIPRQMRSTNLWITPQEHKWSADLSTISNSRPVIGPKHSYGD